MATRSIFGRLFPWLAGIWVLAAAFTVRASTFITYDEHRAGITPAIEWPRVASVWLVLAAQLYAFAWLLTRIVHATTLVQRGLWVAAGFAIACLMTLTLGGPGHGPSEFRVPFMLAPMLVVFALTAGMFLLARRRYLKIRARTG